MNVVNSVRTWFIVRLLAHLLRALAIGGIIAVFTAITAFAVLKLLGVDHVFPAKFGVAEGAAHIGLIVGIFVAFSYFITYFPPNHTSGLRKGRRYRVKKPFLADGHWLREGETLVFKREYQFFSFSKSNPREGREYILFVDESNMERAITSEHFSKPSDWTHLLEELSDNS